MDEQAAAEMLDSLLKEFWIEYAFGSAFLLLRLFARWKTAGLHAMQLDDGFILFAYVSPEFWRASTRLAVVQRVNQFPVFIFTPRSRDALHYVIWKQYRIVRRDREAGSAREGSKHG